MTKDKATTELDWDSEIDPNEVNKQPELLPEGVVRFGIMEIKRDVRDMGKLGNCKVRDLTMLCTCEDDPEQFADVSDSLPLHKDMLWKILQFCTSIGQREHGDEGKFVPNWDTAADGAQGRAVIGHRTFKKRDGTEGTVNQIVKYLAPDEVYEAPKKGGATTTAAKTEQKKPELKKAAPKQPPKF